MPDVIDRDRGLKYNYTDEDYEDYLNGNMSDSLYGRRNDGSITHEVKIECLEESPRDNLPVPVNDGLSSGESPSGEPDTASAVAAAAIGAAVMGLAVVTVHGIKKLWGRHKAKKAAAKRGERSKELSQNQEDIQAAIAVLDAAPETERKDLTQEEAFEEVMKIIAGMTEIADGKRKVEEGAENLAGAGVIDKQELLERLSSPQTLESLNTYLSQNPQLVERGSAAWGELFGREIVVDSAFVPITMSEIESQLHTKTIEED